MAAFGQGGWTPSLPIGKSEAESEFGHRIPDDIWSTVELAWEKHIINSSDLEGTKLNLNPNDAQGWMRRKKDSESSLSIALAKLDELNQDFISEVVDNLAMQGKYQDTFLDWRNKLDRTRDDILALLFIVTQAEPLDVEILTDAESRKVLAKEMFEAMKPIGAKLSTGYELGQRKTSNADLTGFEKLIELMGIHRGDTPAATSKWLRDATAQN